MSEHGSEEEDDTQFSLANVRLFGKIPPSLVFWPFAEEAEVVVRRGVRDSGVQPTTRSLPSPPLSGDRCRRGSDWG